MQPQSILFCRSKKMGSAEKLLKFDDIATTLVLDPPMGFTRPKLSNADLPPLHAESTEEMLEILKNFKRDQDTEETLGQLLSTQWAKEATASMSERERAPRGELAKLIEKYLKGLTVEAGFKLEPDDRFIMENCKGAKVVATKHLSKGEDILVGPTSKISKDQERQLTLRGVDTSCMLRSSMSNRVQVIFGPITLTNHSCVPNCEFECLESKMVSLRASRDIEPGEELTIYYGENYFGRNNKGCQCSDCKEKKNGYFRKLKPGERREPDLFTPEDDKAILKVYNMVGGPSMCLS